MIESYLFTSTLRDLLKFRKSLVWLIVAALMFGVGKMLIQVNPGQTAQESYTLLSSVLVFRLLPLAAAIFSAVVVSQEVEQRTIVYLLTRPVPRWKLLVFRSLAAAVMVFLVSVLAGVFVSLAAYGKPFQPMLGNDIVAIAIGALAYTSLFTLISVVINRAMVICLLFAFGWETSIPNIPGDIYWLSINSYLTSIAHHPKNSGSKGLLDVLGGLLGNTAIKTSTAWIVLLVLSAACLAGGALLFSTREMVPRDDSE